MGTLTITTTSPQDARIVVAFGHHLGFPRNANADEVKAAVIDFIRNVVLQDERRIAQEAVAQPDPLDPT